MLLRHRPTRSYDLRLDGGVQEADLLDEPTAGIREQGVGDPVRRGESLQRLDRVVADGIHGDRVVSGFSCPLQLDQLRSTPRSPVGASVKDDQGLPSSSMLVEVDRLAVLVVEDHIGEPRSDRRPDPLEVDIWNLQLGEVGHRRSVRQGSPPSRPELRSVPHHLEVHRWISDWRDERRC